MGARDSRARETPGPAKQPRGVFSLGKAAPGVTEKLHPSQDVNALAGAP